MQDECLSKIFILNEHKNGIEFGQSRNSMNPSDRVQRLSDISTRSGETESNKLIKIF